MARQSQRTRANLAVRDLVTAAVPLGQQGLAEVLSKIEGIGWVVADAQQSGHGLDAASCGVLCDDLRAVYRIVRRVAGAGRPALGVTPAGRAALRRTA